MQSETKKQWWQQLTGMSQGLLFLQGHVAHDSVPASRHAERPHHVHDEAGQVRHRRAMQRLGARRVRAMTSLSLFR
ncbi:hypothetical protein MMG85_05650 [Pseudoxanthomonas sp. LH2527]|uniref:hypothetical protein n=1 Tax=Pseudoxanthomonas sp. LH2527 TaxID=2923249 RepID=UPI001F138790|nr:hypothetical protein [Pseudoxanthomonas sp. LH2527]MCH6483046.1 hypothetical protein [Pseudoxanthomonas sp. LH2527]